MFFLIFIKVALETTTPGNWPKKNKGKGEKNRIRWTYRANKKEGREAIGGTENELEEWETARDRDKGKGGAFYRLQLIHGDGVVGLVRGVVW